MNPLRYEVYTIEVYGTRPYKVKEPIYPCKVCGKDPDAHDNINHVEDPVPLKQYTLRFI